MFKRLFGRGDEAMRPQTATGGAPRGGGSIGGISTGGASKGLGAGVQAHAGGGQIASLGLPGRPAGTALGGSMPAGSLVAQQGDDSAEVPSIAPPAPSSEPLPNPLQRADPPAEIPEHTEQAPAEIDPEAPAPPEEALDVDSQTSEHPSPEPAPDRAETIELPWRDEQAQPAAGASIGSRYTVLGTLTAEAAAALLGEGTPIPQADLYAVEDQRGYERCWSCGSANNEAGQRFCVDCGAPLQHRQLVLARSALPTGEAEEFAEDGAWYHLVLQRKHFGSAGITLEAGGFSAEGPHHPNEDSYWSGVAGGCYDSASESFGVFVLADGMGGYAPGSGLISKDIVQTVGRGIFSILQAEPDTQVQGTDLQAIVRGAIAQANGRVLDQIDQHGEMGATLVAAVVYGQTVFVANIGDSRAYYISPAGAVTQITRDQSLIEQQVAAGLVSPEAVYTAIGNNVILHAIGEPAVEEASDWYEHPLEPGGRLMLCSDGYWKTMASEVWIPDIATQQPTLRLLARALVEQALALNSDDNTTVLLIGID